MQILSFVHRSKEIIQQIISPNLLTANANKRVYESEDVVEFYAEQKDLQEPELTILNELRERLPNMSMLDIGVGAGRTTMHFAHLAKEYVGIDYSNKMINSCMKKFKNFPKKISFLNVDAINMKIFKDNSFDFVLFSLNGIDYVDHEERIEILREIRRLIRAGGYFCFSTHNLNSLTKKCSIHLSKHPTLLALRIYRLLQMRLPNKRETWRIAKNFSKIQQKHVMFFDGAHNFRLKTYYISPIEQLKQLKELGYSATKIYSSRDGREIENPNEAMDDWVYFLSC